MEASEIIYVHEFFSFGWVGGCDTVAEERERKGRSEKELNKTINQRKSKADSVECLNRVSRHG